MPSVFDVYNPSILAIPALHILSILPHAYALKVSTQGDPNKWDNRNPRSSTMQSKIKDRLDPEDFAFYERLQACHANGMENLPIFATAVILGNMAGLKKDGVWGMTGFAASFLAVRVAYTAAYLTHKTQGQTMIRSGLWATGVGLCFRVIFKAAKALTNNRTVF